MSKTWKRRNRPTRVREVPAKAFLPRCKTMTSGDEHYCGCGIRWGFDEERPACPKKEET